MQSKCYYLLSVKSDPINSNQMKISKTLDPVVNSCISKIKGINRQRELEQIKAKITRFIISRLDIEKIWNFLN